MKTFKIEIKNRFTRNVIFTYESEKEGTIKDAVKEAVKNDTNLRGAYLRGADLSYADLSGANKIPINCKWTHGITDGMIHIGCEKRTIKEWDAFFASNDEIETPRNTYKFKQIQAVYNAYKAYLQTLETK
jgi:hypothetical protein